MSAATHAAGEEPYPSSAIHLPFEHFETIDLPLNWPRAPTQGDARFDGIIIRPQAIGKALKRLETTGGGTLEPTIELAGLTLTHELGKVLGQRDGFADFALMALEPASCRFSSSLSLASRRMTSQVARLGVSGVSTSTIVAGDPDLRRLVIRP